MTLRSKETLTGYFEDGDTPTGTNFADLIDSAAINITSTTYADLLAAATAGELIPNQLYQFTYTHSHFQLAPNGTNDGYIETTRLSNEPEPLIVMAATPYTLFREAYSTLYPQDIIHYSLTEGNEILEGQLTGVITWRKDTLRNIDAWCDWRHTWQWRWEDAISGSNVVPAGWGGGQVWSSYIEYRMIPDDNPLNITESFTHIHIGKPNEDITQPMRHQTPDIVIRDKGWKITIGDGVDPHTFRNAEDVFIGSCNSNIFHDTVSRFVSFPENGGNTFRGPVECVTMSVNSHQNTFNSSVSNCFVQVHDQVFATPVENKFVCNGMVFYTGQQIAGSYYEMSNEADLTLYDLANPLTVGPYPVGGNKEEFLYIRNITLTADLYLYLNRADEGPTSNPKYNIMVSGVDCSTYKIYLLTQADSGNVLVTLIVGGAFTVETVEGYATAFSLPAISGLNAGIKIDPYGTVGLFITHANND